MKYTSISGLNTYSDAVLLCLRGERQRVRLTVAKNESVYIPIGMKHRLENRGKILLQMIEVQVGDYLEEDDIERFDDEYGRK